MTEPVPPAVALPRTAPARRPVATGEHGSSTRHGSAEPPSGVHDSSDARREPEPSESPGAPAVLVARSPERAGGLLALLRERGLDPVAAPVIERAPVEDPAALDAARERLASGTYAWVAITSVNAVDALLGTVPEGPAAGSAASQGDEPDETTSGDDYPSARPVTERRQCLRSVTHAVAHTSSPDNTPDSVDTPGTPPRGTGRYRAGAAPTDSSQVTIRRPEPVRWAAVGPATQQALAARGVAVDLVPEIATGAGLAAAFPAAPREPGAPDAEPAPRVLLPLGDLAADTVRAGLEAKGWAVDVVTAYRTVAHELPPGLRRRYDVVVVASGSVARQVAAQLGPQRVVAIGEPSAGTARAVGHTVLAVAAHPTDEALADAVTQALVRP